MLQKTSVPKDACEVTPRASYLKHNIVKANPELFISSKKESQGWVNCQHTVRSYGHGTQAIIQTHISVNE